MFPDRPLSIWDFCCGAGRHTVLLAQMVHHAYGTDISENGINHTKRWLESNSLKATLKVSDMTDSVFKGMNFHGAFSWDALHHNTLENINKAVENIHESLCEGGLFMASLLSTKSGKADLRGKEIKKNTFVSEAGSEAGVPHHYFDEEGIRDLFKKWEILSLVHINTDYLEEKIHYLDNPFPYTKWNVIVKK